METSEEPGRREQNRLRTHNALVQAATRLFQEQGYEATTVRDIAAAAGVGERTFFRYFPSKESLVVQQVRETIPLLAAAIRKRPVEEPPLVALREAVLDLATWHHTTPAMLLVGPQPLSPDLTSRGGRFILFDLEEAVVGAILDRSGIPEPELPDRLRAAALGRAGVAALRSVRLTYSRLPEAQKHDVDLIELVRIAFAALGV
ncbi:AcrR family transcriptional regulator [Kitasatospora sp. GP30]|uniref:TetR family transcriptional regulator n=1 Tax=Kitasatospora sp. GP30 TaxID=3035084 RepID=UPI000C6FE1B6|nr:TetR family transcriptional regulator [Kitasatospora sp. GP30]MDH6144080.1 AcrR family transcriptional regulator [Kitasatospora sp. GP30]